MIDDVVTVKMDYREFIHPDDEIAMRNLESATGFNMAARYFMENFTESQIRGLLMAESVRLSPTQLPEIYNLLPPVCDKLGIEAPEMYLQMDPLPNAWTIGNRKNFIVITSGLLNHISDRRELESVIAHECGHILCRHTFYTTIAMFVVAVGSAIGIADVVLQPLIYALLYWRRQAELSADRASIVYIGEATIPCRALLRLCGGPQSMTKDINLEEYAKQAKEFDLSKSSSKWTKLCYAWKVKDNDHPFMAIRIRELLSWAESPHFKVLRDAMARIENFPICSRCGKRVSESARFCKYCGNSLIKAITD